MLYLYTRIHFYEVNVLICIHQEFYSAQVIIVHCAGYLHCIVIQLIQCFLLQGSRWRHFYHLLKAALHRAVALIQVHNVTVCICSYLYFYMLGPVYKLLQEHRVITKSIFGLATRFVIRLGKILVAAHYAHTTAATAGSRLQHQRVTNTPGLAQCCCFVIQFVLITFYQRDAGLPGHFFCGNFITQCRHGRWAWPNENDTGILTLLCKGRILRKEPIAGVYGISTTFQRHLYYCIHIQVWLQWVFVIPYLVGLISLVSV